MNMKEQEIRIAGEACYSTPLIKMIKVEVQRVIAQSTGSGSTPSLQETEDIDWD